MVLHKGKLWWKWKISWIPTLFLFSIRFAASLIAGVLDFKTMIDKWVLSPFWLHTVFCVYVSERVYWIQSNQSPICLSTHVSRVCGPNITPRIHKCVMSFYLELWFVLSGWLVVCVFFLSFSDSSNTMWIRSDKNCILSLQFSQAHQNCTTVDWKKLPGLRRLWFLLWQNRNWCKQHESTDPSYLVSLFQAGMTLNK